MPKTILDNIPSPGYSPPAAGDGGSTQTGMTTGNTPESPLACLAPGSGSGARDTHGLCRLLLPGSKDAITRDGIKVHYGSIQTLQRPG